jgi:hypothetical protein
VKTQRTLPPPATRPASRAPGPQLSPTYTIPTLERTSTRHLSLALLLRVAPPALQVLLPWLSPVLSPWLYREGDNQGRIQVLTQVAYARHPRQLGKRSTRCGREALHTMRGRKALHTMRARAYLQITTRGLDSVCVSRHSRAARHRQRIDRGSARARSRPFSLLCMPSNTETRVLFCIIAADKINSLSLIHINNRVLHCDSIKGSNVPGAGFDPLRGVTRLHQVIHQVQP